MSERVRVLIVDDETGVAESLALMLGDLGAEVRTAADPQGAIAELERWWPDLVLCDLRMPRGGGRRLVSWLRGAGRPVRIVVMSAYGTVDTAREALSWGADDYLSKPIAKVDLERLLADLDGAARMPGPIPAEPAPPDARFGALVGRSPAMRVVFELIERIAPFPAPVHVFGESGVGKELVAREIHARSGRREGPFVAVNCGAIPGELLESELFGYQRGAFTGADRDHEGLIRSAHGGTIFLDEIGDLPLPLQVKLLRVIQEGRVQPLGATRAVEVDVRWITATNRDLEAAVARGEFREDLYFRINVIKIHVPPLRERGDDLALLVGEILHRLEQRYRKGIAGLEATAYERLRAHSWPGNVREVENLLERAYILTDGAWVTAEALAGLGTSGEGERSQGEGLHLELESLSIKAGTRKLERLLIAEALRRTGGNRTQAAKLLEISPRALIYKIQDYGLESEGRS